MNTTTTEDQGIVVRNGFVVLNEMADRLNKHRSGHRRAIIKAGITPTKLRLASTGGQFVNVITREEAERFLANRRAESLTGDQVDFITAD